MTVSEDLINTRGRGPVRILISAIPAPDGREGRREREQGAVLALLRHALGEDCTLGHRPDGAPFVAERPSVFISVSHSMHYAALAIAHCPIGIDLEEPREQLRRVASRVFSPEELSACPTLFVLTRAWTLKEALYKLSPSPAACDFRTNISIDPPAVCGRVAEIVFEKSLAGPDAILTAVREKVC